LCSGEPEGKGERQRAHVRDKKKKGEEKARRARPRRRPHRPKPEEKEKKKSKRQEKRQAQITAAEGEAKAKGETGARLVDRYKKEVIPALMKDFGYKNLMQVPKLEKIVVNMGLGEAINNNKLIEQAEEQMMALAGQKP